MWYFQLIADESRKFVILPGKDYVLGRRDCDIVIENDQSVSRKHAILRVSHPEANVSNVNKPASITLEDISKFGTFVNNDKVKGEKILQNGDEVRFGTPKSVHRIVYKPFVVTASCVDSQGKKEVRSLVRQIGGHVSNDWRKDCSFLIMKTITVTIKVVCALVSQTPIVTVDYLRDFLKHLREDGQADWKPKVEEYLPSTGSAESLITPDVSFHPAAERSSVFLGMSFYFLCEKHFHKMSLAVELGGGVPILYDDPKTADLDSFLEAKTVVMNPGPGEAVTQPQKNWTEKVRVFLQKKGKRLIQESELGFAVLYCSTDDYCNADKVIPHLLSAPLASQSQNTQAASLASQALTADSFQASHQPRFRKPATVPARGANTAATSKHVDTTETESKDKEQAGRSMQSHKVKREEVFTVPDNLTEDTIKTEVHKGGRSAPTALAEFIKEEPADVSESLFTASSGLGDSRGRASNRIKADVSHTSSAAIRSTRSRSKSPAPNESSAVSPVRHETQAGTASSSRPELVSDSDTQASSKPWGEKRPVVKVEDGSSTLTSQVLFDSSVPAVKKEIKEDRKSFSFLDNADDDDDDDVVVVRKPAPARKKRLIQEVSSEEDEENPFDFPKKSSKTSSTSVPKTSRGKRTRSPSPVPEPTTDKRCKRSPSPKPTRSVSPVPEARKDKHPEPAKSPSPTPDLRSSKRGNRSPSPRPTKSASPAPEPRSSRRSKRSPSPAPETESIASTRSHEHHDDESKHPQDAAPACPAAVPAPSASQKHSMSSASSSKRDAASIPDGRPAPQGFLTTRLPIEDQVEVNSRFEKENIDTPAVIVEFEDLVARPVKTRNQRKEDQSDVPAGMMRWEGKLVPNFKKFSKVRKPGAAYLPRIIGGRDLEEHSSASKKVMDDWLKEMVEGEHEQSQKDREADKLFNWQPPTWGKKKKH